MGSTPIRTKEEPMATVALKDWRELAHRVSDGLDITLLWSKSANRVKVEVADTREGDQFELEVSNADALAAFYHPFAFAISLGLRRYELARD
jgi:hypothetical protein